MGERQESEKDWMAVKFNENDIEFFVSRLKEGRTLNYILTSNYEIHVTDQSHKYFAKKNQLSDEDIVDEGTLQLSGKDIRTESWPHHQKDRMLSPLVNEKINETFKNILKD